jgi:hypothetical protein
MEYEAYEINHAVLEAILERLAARVTVPPGLKASKKAFDDDGICFAGASPVAVSTANHCDTLNIPFKDQTATSSQRGDK